MSHTPRYDTGKVDPVGLKSILVNFANNYFLELWLDSPLKDKIFIGSHNLECSGKSRTNRYTDKRTGQYDGVHMYGRAGAAAYTESVVNILLSSFQSGSSTQKNQETQKNNDDSHRTERAPKPSTNRRECIALLLQEVILLKLTTGFPPWETVDGRRR